jgi:PTS system nitrogen regulatory IIA component
MLDQASTPVTETLASFTGPELICPELSTSAAHDVISELCAVLRRQGHITDLMAFQEAVLAREAISPTAFASGWALPHARLCDVPELRFAVARTVQPLAWFGNTVCQVQTVFLFAVPDHAAKAYLNLISAVARLTQNNPLLDRLRTAADAHAIFNVLKEVPLPRAHVSASIRVTPRLSVFKKLSQF